MWPILLCVVLALWLVGRFARKQWSAEPSLYVHKALDGSSKTLTIMWTGAFNDATIHLERLVPLYQQLGDVLVVRYADLRFDLETAVQGAYEFAREHNYELIILRGTSLGGKATFAFSDLVLENPDYAPRMQRICSDTPLNGRHLPPPAWLLGILQYVHIGPFFNLLSPLVTRLWFKPLKPSEMNGVDQAHLDRHMAAMRRCKLSVIVEQTADIVVYDDFMSIDAVDTVLQYCETDGVIKADAAKKELRYLLDDRLVGEISVPGGHVQCVERHADWHEADLLALRRLGHVVPV